MNAGSIDNKTFPPHLSAPGGGGVPGHSNRRRVGKLYLASVAGHAAAAQHKEDRTNVMLALTNKTQPSTPSNRKFATNIAAMRSLTMMHLPQPIQQWLVKKISSKIDSSR
jgi:hypothetical protein